MRFGIRTKLVLLLVAVALLPLLAALLVTQLFDFKGLRVSLKNGSYAAKSSARGFCPW